MRTHAIHARLFRTPCLRGAMVVLAVAAAPALRAVTLSDVTVCDVTPSGFTAVWTSSGDSTSGIELYADAAGATSVSGDPAIEFNPMATGGTAGLTTSDERAARRTLQAKLQDKHVHIVRVSRLPAGQTVYFRPRTFDPTTGSDNLDGAAPTPVQVDLADVTRFVPDAQLLGVQFTGYNATGAVALVEGPSGIATTEAVVGDGSDPDTAVFNLTGVVNQLMQASVDLTSPVEFTVRLLGDGVPSGTITHSITFEPVVVAGSFSTVAFQLSNATPAYFAFDVVPDQDAGLAFIVTVRAMTSDNAPAAGYTGTPTLSGARALALGGGAMAPFVNGVGTAVVRLDTGGSETLYALDDTLAGNSGTFLVRGSYGAWRTANSAGVDGPTADPGGHGVPNLHRYAFATGQDAADRGGMPTYGTVVSAGKRYLTVSFQRLPAPADIVYRVEASNDLQHWSLLRTVNPGSPATVTTQDVMPLSAALRSLRVVVVQTPSFASYLASNALESVRNDPSLLLPGADPGSTGITNLERYAYGLDYQNPDTAGLPVVSTVTVGADTFLQVTFHRLDEGADVAYVVQAGSDTTSWETIQTVNPGTPTTVTVQDTTPLVGGSDRTMRVVVQQVSAP